MKIYKGFIIVMLSIFFVNVCFLVQLFNHDIKGDIYFLLWLSLSALGVYITWLLEQHKKKKEGKL